jgi:uncharacterized protein
MSGMQASERDRGGGASSANANVRVGTISERTNGPMAIPVSGSIGQIAAFLACVFLLLFPAVALKLNLDRQNLMLERFTMWGPGTAALLTGWLYRIDPATLGWHWPARRWLVLGYVIPLLYAAPVYLATWLLIDHSFVLQAFMDGLSSSYNLASHEVAGTFVVGIPLLLTVGVLSTVTWALGEELGWRGFLFPRLVARFGFNTGCIATGVVWAAWHYPDLLWGRYNAGTNPVFALACFTASVVAMSFVSGWLRLRSESIWPSVLLHASHNLFIQGILDPLTATTGLARYVTTEFGIGLSLTIAAAAYLACSRTVVRKREIVWTERQEKAGP